MGKKYIIVAEDDKYYANLFKIKLTKEGYDVLVVGDGNEAIRAIKTKIPDLLLLDLVMPVKDGFEVLKEVREDPDLKNLKVVVLSNLGQQEDVKKANEYRVLGYFVKSDTSFQEVISNIQKFL